MVPKYEIWVPEGNLAGFCLGAFLRSGRPQGPGKAFKNTTPKSDQTAFKYPIRSVLKRVDKEKLKSALTYSWGLGCSIVPPVLESGLSEPVFGAALGPETACDRTRTRLYLHFGF